MNIFFFFFYSLVDYATGNVCANFHGDCAIDGRDLSGGLIQPPPPPGHRTAKKNPAWLGLRHFRVNLSSTCVVKEEEKKLLTTEYNYLQPWVLSYWGRCCPFQCILRHFRVNLSRTCLVKEKEKRFDNRIWLFVTLGLDLLRPLLSLPSNAF